VVDEKMNVEGHLKRKELEKSEGDLDQGVPKKARIDNPNLTATVAVWCSY